MRSAICVLALLIGATAMCWGNAVPVGALALSEDDSAGTLTFVILNSTGGFPGFPVLDSLDFTNLSLTVNCANSACESVLGGSSAMFAVPDIPSGFPDSSIILALSDMMGNPVLLSSAELDGTFSLTNLTVDDGMGGTASFFGSTTFSTMLLPASGPSLDPSSDAAYIMDPAGTPPAVPEPGTLDLLGLGLASAGALRMRGHGVGTSLRNRIQRIIS